MVIELRVVQFWSETILVISNRTRAARSFDFEITRMISDQIALHSVQLPLLMRDINNDKDTATMLNCFQKTSNIHSYNTRYILRLEVSMLKVLD